MTILVTGATGFVGLNLCEHLLSRGDAVVGFSHRPMPEATKRDFSRLSGDLRMVAGDVLDSEAVKRVFAETSPARVIHTAAMTPGVEAEREVFRKVMETNVVGTVNVLEAAARQGVGRVLHLSSGAVYGQNAFAAEELAEEDPPPLPETLYAVSKYAGEKTALRLRRNWKMDLVAVRLGTVFGPWEYATGVRDTLSGPLLTSQLALEGKEAVLSGVGRRDWLYARDLAVALAGLLDAPAPRHELYNLGSGKVWDMQAWCDKLRARHPLFSWRIAGQTEEANVELYEPTRRSPLSTSRLREETGFQARYGLEEAFTDFMEWSDSQPKDWPR